MGLVANGDILPLLNLAAMYFHLFCCGYIPKDFIYSYELTACTFGLDCFDMLCSCTFYILMYPSVTPTPYKVFYIVVPTISIIGNGCIVYVTILSKQLRSPCSILIALLSLADMVLVSSNIISMIAYNINQSDAISHTSCVYLQLPSVFAACLAPMLLLSVATDRLFSLMMFYKPLVASHYKMYIVAQLLPGCSTGFIVDVWAMFHRNLDERGVCTLATPMKGLIYDLYFKVIMVTSVLTVLCYVCFIFFLKRIRMSSEKVKSIYRSLIIISLTVVLGFFSTSIIVNISAALQLNIEIYHLHLFAGAFANVTSSINFFVYYAVSQEYRAIFDTYLGIGYIKKKLADRRSHAATTLRIAPSVNGSGRTQTDP